MNAPCKLVRALLIGTCLSVFFVTSAHAQLQLSDLSTEEVIVAPAYNAIRVALNTTMRSSVLGYTLRLTNDANGQLVEEVELGSGPAGGVSGDSDFHTFRLPGLTPVPTLGTFYSYTLTVSMRTDPTRAMAGRSLTQTVQVPAPPNLSTNVRPGSGGIINLENPYNRFNVAVEPNTVSAIFSWNVPSADFTAFAGLSFSTLYLDENGMGIRVQFGGTRTGSFTLTNLVPNEDYWFYLDIIPAGTEIQIPYVRSLANGFTVTTLPVKLDRPEFRVRANTRTRTSATLEWTPQTEAQTYVFVDRDANILSVPASFGEISFDNLVHGEEDIIQVYVYAAGKLRKSDILSYEILPPQLPPPVITSIDVGVMTVQVNWDGSAIGDASSYVLSVAGAIEATTVLASAGMYELVNLAEGTTYTLSVVAQAEDYIASDASTQTFTTKVMLAMPVLSVVVDETTLTFSWSEVANAVEYEVNLYSGTDRTAAAIRSERDVKQEGEIVSMTISGLRPVETYTVEVTALAVLGSNFVNSEAGVLAAQTRKLTLPSPTEAEIMLSATTDTLTVEVVGVPSVYSDLYSGEDVDFNYLLSLESQGVLVPNTGQTLTWSGETIVHTYEGLAPNTEYELVVIANSPANDLFNDSERGIFNIRTEQDQLPVPSGFSVVADVLTATLSWVAGEAGEATTYSISVDGGGAVEAAVSDQSYTLTGLAIETTYTLSIVARAQGFRDSEPYEMRFRTQRDVIDSIRLRLRVFLQGATAAGPSGAYMRTGLVLRGQLPASSSAVRPWPGLPENLEEVEVLPTNRDAVDTGVVSMALAGVPEYGSTGIVDWVVVEVRIVNRGSAVPLSTTDAKRIQRFYALLRSDGSVVNADAGNLLATDGVFEASGLDFSRSTEDLYVIINHRNHIDVIAATKAEALGANTYRYDFTMMSAEASRAAGMSLRAGVWTLSAGDYDGNGVVNVGDGNAQAGEFGTAGYSLGDINLDADVNLNDRSVLIDSIGKSQLFRN